MYRVGTWHRRRGIVVEGDRALRYCERVRTDVVHHETARLNLVYGTAHFDNEISRWGKDHAVTKTHLFH